MSSVGYAEIKKEADSFDGSASITSRIKNVDSFNSVHFGKLKTQKGSPFYSLMIIRIESEWWSFEDSPLEMKIAGKIYNLPLFETDNQIFGINNLLTSGTWIVKEEMKKRILKADSITIRVKYHQHPSTTLSLSSKMLDEWKQVIRMKF